MDVHGGKAIIEGPLNYLGSLYRGVPIGITVEGANIVTRSLIQFGQGAIRCHPYLLKEMMALEDADRARGLDAFDQAFWGHVGHSLANTARAFGRAWTGGLFAPAPDAGAATRFYRQLGRYAAAFALAVDLALLTLGGGFKRKEMLSARFGDILSELYLSSAALKRWNDEGRQTDDLPLLEWCMESSFATIETRFDEIIANFPVRPVGWLLRFFILPFGRRRRGPSDRVTDRLRRHHHRAVGDARPSHRRSVPSARERTRSRPRAARARLRPDGRGAADPRPHARGARARHRSGARSSARSPPTRRRSSRPQPTRSRRLSRSTISRRKNSPRGAPTRKTCHRKRSRNRHRSAAASGRVERRPVYIVDGSRTPFIKARGRPGPFTPVDLAVQCGRPLLLRQPFAPDAFDQVILGCVNVIADEMNPARVAALRLGMGEAMTAFTVQINCGSGMQSIDTAYRYIREGVADLILAGGAESLSHAPLVFSRSAVNWYARLFGARSISARGSSALLGFRPSLFKPVIGLERGLTDPITDLNMGQTAELVGHLFHITRRQADEYAAESQQRLAAAQKDGHFAGEIEPAFARDGKVFDHDDGVRPDSTRRQPRQAQARFRAAVGQGDAGQQLADHRRRLLGHSRFGRRGQRAQAHAARPSSSTANGRRSILPIMGLGPVYCSTAMLKRHQLALDDIELWELNEAFAAQVLGCLAAWEDAEFCRDALGLAGAAGRIRARPAQCRRRRHRCRPSGRRQRQPHRAASRQRHEAARL